MLCVKCMSVIRFIGIWLKHSLLWNTLKYVNTFQGMNHKMPDSISFNI